MAVVRVTEMSEVQLAYAVLVADLGPESAPKVWEILRRPAREDAPTRYDPLRDAHQFRMVLHKVLARGATIAKSTDWGFVCRNWTANVEFRADTIELAVCRCYAHSVFGYTVDLPDEIV